MPRHRDGRNAHDHALDLLRPLIGRSGIEVHGYVSSRFNSILRVDEQMLVSLHLWAQGTLEAPLLNLQRTGPEGLFDRFAEHYDALWQDASLPLKPKQHPDTDQEQAPGEPTRRDEPPAEPEPDIDDHTSPRHRHSPKRRRTQTGHADSHDDHPTTSPADDPSRGADVTSWRGERDPLPLIGSVAARGIPRGETEALDSENVAGADERLVAKVEVARRPRPRPSPRAAGGTHGGTSPADAFH